MLTEKKLVGLDLLRFLMCILMALYHFQEQVTNSFLNFLSFNGFFATSSFFILSGFILTYIYHTKILNPDYKKIFFIRRISALYPIHIITLLFTAIIFISLKIIKGNLFEPELFTEQKIPGVISEKTISLDIVYFVRYFFESVFLLHAWDPKYLFFNGPSWSISTLMFFYLLFPELVRKINKQNKLIIYLIFLWFLYMIVPFYFTYTANFSSDIIGLLHRNPLLRLPEFISGIMLFFIINKNFDILKKYYIFFIGLGFLGFLLMGFLVKSNPYIWFYLSHNGLFMLFQISLIIGFCFVDIKSKKIVKTISRLAKASLVLYMIHIIYLEFFLRLYKVVISARNTLSWSEFIIYYKGLKTEELITTPVLLLLISSLILISIFLQELIFTQLQMRLSDFLTSKFKHKIILEEKQLN